MNKLGLVVTWGSGRSLVVSHTEQVVHGRIVSTRCNMVHGRIGLVVFGV